MSLIAVLAASTVLTTPPRTPTQQQRVCARLQTSTIWENPRGRVWAYYRINRSLEWTVLTLIEQHDGRVVDRDRATGYPVASPLEVVAETRIPRRVRRVTLRLIVGGAHCKPVAFDRTLTR